MCTSFGDLFHTAWIHIEKNPAMFLNGKAALIITNPLYATQGCIVSEKYTTTANTAESNTRLTSVQRKQCHDISYAIIDFFLFYGLTVARCPFPAIAEGCPGLQGLHQTVHHAGFISLCKRANYTGNGHYTVTGSHAADRRGRKKKTKHDDKRERVFKRTYRSANARTRLLPAVIPIVARESGAPQVHGRPLRSEPHGGHESECDITISLYCTTA